jgi:2-oxoglutarate dehydrogenase complex dehydrogenase (E1) component-like enzyme
MSSLWNDFQGVNRDYALELYERFLQDPASVDADSRRLFETIGPPPADLRASTPIGAPVANTRGAITGMTGTPAEVAVGATATWPPPSIRSAAARSATPRSCRKHIM